MKFRAQNSMQSQCRFDRIHEETEVGCCTTQVALSEIEESKKMRLGFILSQSGINYVENQIFNIEMFLSPFNDLWKVGQEDKIVKLKTYKNA